MCLYVDANKTKRMLSENKGWMQFWKVYDVQGNTIRPPYYDDKQVNLRTNEIRMEGYSRHISPKRFIHSYGNTDSRHLCFSAVYEGIHCHMKHNKCLQRSYYGLHRICIKVWGHTDDLIAVGKDDDIAFTKIRIDEKDYQRLLNIKYGKGKYTSVPARDKK